MKLGILGGTFNPPHIGHLILAQQVLEKAGLNEVIFIPTNIPPHKQTELATATHRLAMVRAAVEDNPAFSVLDIELERGGVSYTVDTLARLKKIRPDDKLYLIIGSDLAGNFSSWRYPEKIMSLAEIIVACRKGFSFDNRDSFATIEVLTVEVSSSLIRNLIKEKKSIKYLVHPAVAGYIEKHRLYSR